MRVCYVCLQAKPDALVLPKGCAKLDAENGNKYSGNRAKAQAGRRMAETAKNATRADLVQDIIAWFTEAKSLGLSEDNFSFFNKTHMVRVWVAAAPTRDLGVLMTGGPWPVSPRFHTLYPIM